MCYRTICASLSTAKQYDSPIIDNLKARLCPAASFRSSLYSREYARTMQTESRTFVELFFYFFHSSLSVCQVANYLYECTRTDTCWKKKSRCYLSTRLCTLYEQKFSSIRFVFLTIVNKNCIAARRCRVSKNTRISVRASKSDTRRIRIKNFGSLRMKSIFTPISKALIRLL